MSIPFTKVEAIGNTFVLINGLETPDLNWASLAVDMCRHRFGVGSDGLLAIVPSDEADFRIRMFNPDGTEDACGNGLRCAAVYAREKGLTRKTRILFEARDGMRAAEITANGVRVNMGPPSTRPDDIPTTLKEGVSQLGGYDVMPVMIGTPHAVICADLEFFWDEIPPVSAEIETHPVFPERISVTWCCEESENSLIIRTWERGVGPTLSCGTGACAALVTANLNGLVGSRATVKSPGGTLEVEWPDRQDLLMTGPARILFSGVWR